jgi:hypothetical protein
MFLKVEWQVHAVLRAWPRHAGWAMALLGHLLLCGPGRALPALRLGFHICEIQTLTACSERGRHRPSVSLSPPAWARDPSSLDLRWALQTAPSPARIVALGGFRCLSSYSFMSDSHVCHFSEEHGCRLVQSWLTCRPLYDLRGSIGVFSYAFSYCSDHIKQYKIYDITENYHRFLSICLSCSLMGG